MSALVNPLWSKDRRRKLRLRQTSTEEFLWQELRNRRCGGVKFRRQVGIGVYIADFYSFEQKLVIEVDGGHHFKASIRAYDQDRSDFFQELGIKTLRFTNQQVSTNIETVRAAIIAAFNHLQPSSRSGEGMSEA